jgi:ATP-dependent DNA helicase DinG
MLHRPESRAEALAQLAIFCWRFQSRDGRREELSDHVFFEEHWLALFESVEPCSPHICHKDPLCFVVAARRSAREAPVVIVNHSLLMMDLRSAQGLLGPSRLLIVDEAHELPPVATNALSHWIKRDRLEVYRNLSGEKTRGGLREVFEEILKIVGGRPGGDRLRECTRALDAALDAWYNAYHRWFDAVEESCRSRLSEGSARVGRHRYHDGDEAFGMVRDETNVLLERAEELHRDLAKVLDASGDLAELLPEMQDDREALVSLLSFHSDLCDGIKFCLSASDEDWVYWIEWGGTRGLSAIVAAPLTVEEPLSQLWDTHYRSVIMTSATLAVGEDFTPFAESVGFSKVSRYTESLLIPSPFQFDEQALVLTTPELVDPKEEGFPAVVAELLQQIGTRVATKILMLSTSYQLIDEIYEILRPVFSLEAGLFSEESGHARTRLLRQTPGGSRERLVSEFRDAAAAILLATGSFWEGVDFPGRQLEVLVVPRLPFAVPTEPLTQGRFDRAKRLGRDPFLDVSLNDAVLRLKQGVGRLLRTSEDRGVVLLLDKRLQEKSYGVTFLRSMPRSCEWVPSRAEMAQRVVDFLSKP